MTVRSTRVDPDIGIPDLIRRLGEDSKRLASDEIRLAKLEIRESMHTAARGSLWLGVAFGIGVVALTAFTVFLAAALGALFDGNYWAGALITGALELIVAAVMIRSGVAHFAGADYTLVETREEARETARWVSEARAELRERPMVASPPASAEASRAPMR